MAWLPATSMTVAPARSAIARCAGGGIIRSSVATRYQLGLTRQAGSVIAPPSAPTPHGTCESAMNAACRRATSPANDAANLSRSRNRKPSCGRQDRRNRRTGRRVGDQGVDRLALVGRERRDVHERRDLSLVAGLGDHGAAVGVADEDDRSVVRVDHLLGGRDVALEGHRRVLHDADVDPVRVSRS